jgi:hypothetical protein
MKERNGTIAPQEQTPGHQIANVPLDTVADGKPGSADRTAAGTFAPGNKCGRGNPHAGRMAALRGAMLETITGEPLKALAERLYVMAVSGDTAAAG